tara:strand:+ start:2181 stop:2522 length:342 start_codon:yes stop_codon:yes gene_type:complete
MFSIDNFLKNAPVEINKQIFSFALPPEHPTAKIINNLIFDSFDEFGHEVKVIVDKKQGHIMNVGVDKITLKQLLSFTSQKTLESFKSWPILKEYDFKPDCFRTRSKTKKNKKN